MNKERARAILLDIEADTKHDATDSEAQPFTGKTVAAYLGGMGAAVAALARILHDVLDEPDAPGEKEPQGPKAAKSSDPLYHGVTCEKRFHVGGEYLHGSSDDTPYNVDGVTYCGRCHQAISGTSAREAPRQS